VLPIEMMSVKMRLSLTQGQFIPHLGATGSPA
jgi:hypothetical protein